MKALLSKKMIAGAVAALSLLASAGASAQSYNWFEIRDPGRTDTFQAQKIIGNYNEVITFTATDPNNPALGGTFDVSLVWSAASFNIEGQVEKVPSYLGNFGNGYGLYALYTASGSFTGNGVQTTFNFLEGSGNLSVFLDPTQNTKFAAPTDSSQPFSRTGFTDDILLAMGDPQSGTGTLDTSLSTCPASGKPKPGSIGCGSFGSETTFTLVDNATGLDGADFFVGPNPFYNLSFQAGQLNRFDPIGRVVIDGSMDVVFGEVSEVPEPASLGLLGLGLLGLGAASRRKKVK